MAQILLIEDDSGIGTGLTTALQSQGHEVSWCRTGRDGLAAAAADAAPLVLLDLGLPDIDGIELCRQLRRTVPQAAIIVITARAEEIDVVLGLDSGADDYVTKPFRLGELLARLRSHERRLEQGRAAGTLTAGSLEVDVPARRAHVRGGELSLTRKEFDLLVLLILERGRVVSRERIIDSVWDENWYRSTKTLDMHILALRRKLTGSGVLITTVRGVGYRLDAE